MAYKRYGRRKQNRNYRRYRRKIYKKRHNMRNNRIIRANNNLKSNVTLIKRGVYPSASFVKLRFDASTYFTTSHWNAQNFIQSQFVGLNQIYNPRDLQTIEKPKGYDDYYNLYNYAICKAAKIKIRVTNMLAVPQFFFLSWGDSQEDPYIFTYADDTTPYMFQALDKGIDRVRIELGPSTSGYASRSITKYVSLKKYQGGLNDDNEYHVKVTGKPPTDKIIYMYYNGVSTDQGAVKGIFMTCTITYYVKFYDLKNQLTQKYNWAD